ncbi:TlpA disulfide reductase family protein [Lacinutrix neustonica]|uniref:TlpA disulfide reductase family protein n=1 Tax=Lacinutrix neustonica TaxID=2980107 RepID=A0A9E8MT43_9FLAO|nr:TlpA disulfide reductase family protein [Lacinutrix neustonica]WAC00938.1 TlpA disulfide reductase family protein [Lacinutrix neustonica]
MGVELGGENNKTSDYGELFYSLYFPKLDTNVKVISFGEVKTDEAAADTGFIDHILIDEDSPMLPKALRGDWLLTDGGNRWDYGFHYDKAIVDRAVWNYKSVTNKGKQYTITLERPGALKTVYAELHKDGQVDFGTNPKVLKTYSLEKTHNPNYTFENDVPYAAESLLKVSSTTYSGVIKGYTEAVKDKVKIKIVTQDCFTLKVDFHKVEINDDGSFSIEFPANYPQTILVMSPYESQQEVYVEPGKETFHFITDKEDLFMGDVAALNTGFQEIKLEFRHKDNIEDLKIVRSSIKKSPEEYKLESLIFKDKQYKALEALKKKQFISKKALQVKQIKIELISLIRILNYNRSKKMLIDELNEKEKNEANKLEYKASNVDAAFFDFVPEEILNSRLPIVVSPWLGFATKKLSENSAFKNENSTDKELENNIKTHFELTNSFMLDFIRFQNAYKKFLNNYDTYTDAEIIKLQQEIKDPFISEYLVTANNKAKAYIKENNIKTGYNINTVKKAAGEDLFESLIKPFKGKVIHVDFWATWCGQCIPKIKAIEPLKEEMKDDAIVFLYITNERSPEGQWKDAVSNIRGEHYRVTNDQWESLLTKFNFRGIPHYVLVNKKGAVVNTDLGHPTIKQLKTILEEEIAKE